MNIKTKSEDDERTVDTDLAVILTLNDESGLVDILICKERGCDIDAYLNIIGCLDRVKDKMTEEAFGFIKGGSK